MLSLRPKRSSADLVRDIITFAVVIFLLTYYFFNYNYSRSEWLIVSAFIFIWMLIYFWRMQYYVNKDSEFNIIVSNHLTTFIVFLVLVVLFSLLFPIPAINKKRVLSFVLAFPVLGISVNLLFDNLKGRMFKEEKLVKYTLVAGTGSIAKQVERQLYTQRVSGYEIKGFINCLDNEECLVGSEKVVSDLNDIRQYLNEHAVDEIVIAMPDKNPKTIQNILETADYFGIRVKYVPDYHELFGNHYKHIRFGDIDAFNIRQFPIDETISTFAKRSFDVVFSFVVLILLTPLFLVIAAFIKLDSPGPVFYCPIRIGRSGKPFKVFKFRSMRENDATTFGTLSTQKDDPRITRIGKVLRKYSLDELPQFFNVFLGNMSVVGPRPHRRYLDKQLQESVYRYMIRHYVKPGITGWAQVNGWRGPTDTEEQKRQRTLHDLWYLENWSFWLDIKIIFLTIFSKKAHQTAF